MRARDSGDRFTSIDRVASGMSTEDPNLSRLSQLDCTVTVMFTDIENSTMLAEKYGDTQWMQVLRGRTTTSSAGPCASTAATRSSRRATGSCSPSPAHVERSGARSRSNKRSIATAGLIPTRAVRVRIGLHTGEAIAEGGDLFGRHVILAARIAGHAEGGQILVSQLVCELVAGADDLAFDEGEEVELKGLSGTFFVHRGAVGADGRIDVESPGVRSATAATDGRASSADLNGSSAASRAPTTHRRSVVHGFTKQNRRQVSPRHVVGTVNVSPFINA